MTTRYGPLYATFWDWDDEDYDPITTTPTPLTVLEIESAEVIKKLGQMTRGRFTAPEQPDWEFFLQEGRLVSLYQFDGVLNANREMGGFLMEKVRPALRADGKMGIEVSGLGREKLLTRYRHWAPIGDETTYVTTIGTTVPAPWATTIDVGAPAGNDHVIVDDLGGAQVGDIIRIEMENSDVFVTKIVDIEPPGAPPETAVLEARLPYSSFAGRPVTFRRGRVTVASVAGMGAGLEIQILLDSTAIHQTVIVDVDVDAVQVLLRDGVPSQSSSGKQVTTYDYSAPATDDVTQIMAPAVTAGWELAFGGAYTGTENGTAHQPEGESVWDLLTATAEQSGEFFRISELEAGETPRKKIRWFRANDASNMTLILYDVTSDVVTATENINLGVVHELQREREHNVITRVYPLGADGRISLGYATDAALAEASSAGFAVGTDAGLYGKDYIQYSAGVTAHGVLSDVVRYGNLTLSDKGSVTELQAAADSMLRQAMTTILESQEREYWHVKAHTHRPLFPGQAVALSNTVTEPLQATATFYVLEVRESFEKGVIMSHLTLSQEKQQRPTATVLLGRQLMSTKQAALRPSGAGVTMVGAAVIGGGGGGTTDHGLLLGLGDDDHPHYWNDTRGDAKIATHTAIANAHHNAVTVGNTGLSLSTQQVSLALKASLSGLEISSGVGVVAVATGGLEVTASGVQAKTPANSGLVKDANGLYLAPSTLTAATTNAVSGTGHTHGITATDNANTTVSTILKGDAAGYLTLGGLGVGDTANTSAAIYAKAKAVDDYTLWLKQLANQTADMWRVEDTAGDALIRLTGGGDLESGKPGFVSGQTGWQITATGDAEFNNARIRGELHATVFVADEMSAAGGTVLIKTATTVAPQRAGQANDNVLPAINSTFSLIVDASWDGGLNYLPVNSIIRIKPMGEIAAGGSLDLYDIYLQVTAAGTVTGRDLAEGNPGYFVLTCNRRLGGATGFEIPAGCAAVKWTEVGASGYTGALKLTGDGDGATGPFMDVFTVAKIPSATWAGVAPTIVPRVRVGNLNGVLGKSADEWGMAASTDLSSTNVATPSLVASDLGLALRNIDLKIYDGADPTVELSSTGNLKLGTDTGAAATTGFEFTAATGVLRVGGTSGTGARMEWDGTNLAIRDYSGASMIRFDSDGSSYFAGAMTIGASGGIWQGYHATPGTATFANPQNGIKIWNESGPGRIGLWNAGTQHMTLRYDRGWEIANNGSKDYHSGMTFAKTAGGTVYGRLQGWVDGAYYKSEYEVVDGSNVANITLQADSSNAALGLYVDDGSSIISLVLSKVVDYARLNNAPLYVSEGGIATGTVATVNSGQILSDLDGAAYNSVILTDTTDVAHAMSAVIGANTYGALGKVVDADGGLLIIGATQSTRGIQMAGYGTTADTATSSSAIGAVTVNAAITDGGTSVTGYGANDNLFVVRNNSSSRFIVKGDGDIYYDGADQGAFDAHDDIGLLRTLSRELWRGTIQSEWDKFITTNRRNLVDAGILSEGGFISHKAMQALMVGGLWQLHERLSRLEGQSG